MNMRPEEKKRIASALLSAAAKLEAATVPVLYHGTTSDALTSILSEGLTTSSGWGGAGTEGVYLSNSQTGALMWAMSSLLSKEGEGGDPSRFFRKHKLDELALLEVRIPEDELASLKADMEQAEDYQYDGEEDDWQASLDQIGDVRFDKKVPASWLRVVPPQELEAAAAKLGYARPVSAARSKTEAKTSDDVESVVKSAKSSVARMGGGCFTWAIAIHRVLLPEGRLVVGLNKAIFEDDSRIVGHAAVVVGDPDSPDAQWFDSEGKTDRDRVESWGSLDESEDTWDLYGRPCSLDDWKTAAYETEVVVFDGEHELLEYLPSMESGIKNVEAALRKAMKS